MGRLAEESAKTKKARAKLQMRLAELDKRVNTQALEQKKCGDSPLDRSSCATEDGVKNENDLLI